MNKNHKRVMSGDKRSPAMLEKQRIGAVVRFEHSAHSSPDPVEIVNARLPARLSENHLHDRPVRLASTTLYVGRKI